MFEDEEEVFEESELDEELDTPPEGIDLGEEDDTDPENRYH